MSKASHAARKSRPQRISRLGVWLAIPAALVASGVIVSAASYASFSSSTTNPTSNWNAGSVTLADDDSNSALFNASALKPGSTDSKCIVVTSTGNLPSNVKLYGTTPATTKAFSSYVNLTITQGTGSSFGAATACNGFTPATTNPTVYSGTLANFGSTYTNFSNGADTWAPTGSGSEARTYKFTYTVDPNTPNTSQSGTASLGFTWEAQNN